MPNPTPRPGGAPAAASPRTITAVRAGPEDTLKQMGSVALYRRATEEGMSLSAYLEKEDPSTNYKDGLDAFSRLLKVAGIKVRSMPEQGVSADTFSAFHKSPECRGLVPEWCMRQWKRVHMSPAHRMQLEAQQRASFLSDDAVPGSILRPWFDSQDIYTPALQSAVPLSSLVAQTIQITGTLYRSLYMNDSAADSRMVRVTELGEIPEATLTEGQRTVNLYKYGRSIRASYEALRNAPIDRVAHLLQRMALQAEIDKVATVMDIMINGDGNPNTAAVSYNLTTLDPAATAGTLTLKAWLAFKMKFTNPLTLVTALAQEAVALQMLMLNLGSANVPLVTVQQNAGFGSFAPINPGLADNVRLGWIADAPTLKIVGVDSRLAVERIVQIGANLQETDRYITNQSEVLVVTETEGYAIMDPTAVRILDVNA